MANKINITLSKELKEKIEKRIKKTNFKSVQDYIIYILNEIASENEGTNSFSKQTYTDKEEADLAGSDMLKSLKSYSEEDEIALKKKLNEMGYL